MRKTIGSLILLLTLIASAIGSYLYFTDYHYQSLLNNFVSKLPLNKELTSPFIASPTPKPLPLQQYSIPNLQHYPYQADEIILTELINQSEDLNSYLFRYQTMGKTMTGTANLPANINHQDELPVIIMVRGYAEPEQYYPGFGTKNAAAIFARNGYVTLAPNFFNFGGSDPEPENSWEARFIKPINIIELIKTIQQNPEIFLELAEDESNVEQYNTIKLNSEKIGLWGHSNGGQISISVLEILSEPIPATIWAPVTAPFPYSILFFTRTSTDEGKEARAWLAKFEQEYDVFDFSITQHLDKLSGPLQIHHGGLDKDALLEWSDDFIVKLEQENQRREKFTADTLLKSLTEEQEATTAETSQKIEVTGVENSTLPSPIEFFYFVYPQADHNLQPAANWEKAINRDLNFFEQYL